MGDEEIGGRLQAIIDGQNASRAETAEGFRSLRADLSLVANEVDVIKGRVENLEGRTTSIDEWRRNNSDRVRGLAAETSQHDLSHDSKIASEIVARQALEMKVDGLVMATNTQTLILQRIEKMASNPIVKHALTAIATAALAWAASKGWLSK